MSTPDKAKSLQARAAAHASWAKTTDRTARTAAARRVRDQRFYDQVDPEHKLPEREREQRAGAARRAFYLSMARKSAAKRRANAREVVELRARLAELESTGGGDAA